MRLAQEIRKHTPESYKEYVTSLYEKPETSSGSQAVAGVGITFGKRTIVRVTRKPKIVLTSEIKLLAEEYGRKYEEVLALFKDKKRKIEVREDK